MTQGPFRRLFRNPFRPDGLAREVEDEHEFHLAEKTRELVARGLPPDGARRRAETDFGSRRHWRHEALRERRRARARIRRTDVGASWVLDVLGAARQLRRRPAYALVTLIVLALGVGVGVSVLAAVDAVLLRPLPYAHSDRVVWLRGVLGDFDQWGVSPANWLDWKEMQRSFDALAATRAVHTSLVEGGAEYVPTLRVESRFFQVLGVRPYLGRLLDAGDDRDDAPFVAVLTHALWAGRFGADPDLVGGRITLGGRPATVVGVLPPSFEYLDVPIWGGPERHVFANDVYGGDRTSRWSGGYFWPIALLREGVGPERAQEDMDRIAAALAEAYPGINGHGTEGGPLGVKVTPLRRAVTQDVRAEVLLLGGFVLLLLLVVCGNVAGLVLARTIDRGPELAVRASLGADRWRLARETLAQVALLAGAGLVLGLGVASLSLRVLHAVAPPDVAFLGHAGLDARVTVGALALAVAVWALAGVLPALRAAGVDLDATLRAGGRGASGPRSKAGRAVIVGQLTLATALVTGAGLLLGAYASMAAVEPGVDVEGVHVLRYRLPTARYAVAAGTLSDYPVEFQNDAWAEQASRTPVYRVGAEARAFVDQALAVLSGVPGVVDVSVTNHPPLWGNRAGYGVRAVDEEGDPSPDRDDRYRLKWVTPNYFGMLGIRMLRGRPFTREDDADAPPVLVANRAFVQRFLSDRPSAVGAEVRVAESGSFSPRTFTVVGVVDDVVHRTPSEPVRPAVYVPLAQRAALWESHQVAFPLYAAFLVRVAPGMDVSPVALRAAVSEVDPGLVVQTSTTLRALHDDLYREVRFWLTMLVGFGALALLLAAAGIFALLAQSVRHRTREIGIRRALGASANDVLGAVAGEAVRMAALGLGLGLAASWVLAGLLSDYVSGVEGLGPGPVLGVVIVLLGATTLAAWVPARWAGRVDPVEALRAD